jgi:hypothetical protein
MFKVFNAIKREEQTSQTMGALEAWKAFKSATTTDQYGNYQPSVALRLPFTNRILIRSTHTKCIFPAYH